MSGCSGKGVRDREQRCIPIRHPRTQDQHTECASQHKTAGVELGLFIEQEGIRNEAKVGEGE